MENNYSILFPIEITSRELLSKIGLAIRFSEMGYNCYIGDKAEICNLIGKISPFVYFDKGYHQNKSEEIYKNIKNHGGIIISLDEEGGVDSKDFFTLQSRYSDNVFDFCDLIFLWGDAQYRFLSKNKKNFKSYKVFVSGHPRFQFLKKKFRHFYIDEVDQIKQVYKNYILINTNMGFGNNIRGDKFVYSNYKNRLKDTMKFIRYDKIKLKEYIFMIKEVSKVTRLNIVVRPHPEEDKKIYEEAFRNFNNVFVNNKGLIAPWILGAEFMIHPDCTTGIESVMLGKKSISFLPHYDESILMYLPYKLSCKFDNTDKLIKFMEKKDYKKSLKVKNGDNSLLNKYFAFEKDSIDIIVKNTDDFVKKSHFRVSNENSNLKKIYILKKIIFYFIDKFKVHDKISSHALNKSKRAGLKYREVLSVFNNISEIILD